MNRLMSLTRIWMIYVPRRRGDEPYEDVTEYLDLLCSPQARG